MFVAAGRKEQIFFGLAIWNDACLEGDAKLGISGGFLGLLSEQEFTYLSFQPNLVD